MKSISPSRKDERKQKLRAEILTVASQMFSDRGYEAVTLRAIAENIGYTHAVLYKHFPDKSHILEELCAQTFGLLIRNFDDIAERAATPRDRLFETSRGLMRFCLAHPQHCRIVFFGPENRNGIRAGEYISAIGKPLFDRFEALFLEVARSEQIIAEDMRLVAHTWWCSILGLSMVMIIQGGLPGFSEHERIIEQSISMMWAGLKQQR